MSAISLLCIYFVISCYHSVSAPGIGSPCKNYVDCAAVDGAICRNQTCACSDSYVQSVSNIKCISTVRHQENCTESTQCNYSSEAVCKNNTCKCEANLEYDGSQCIGKSGLGEKCERDTECVIPSDRKQETMWCHVRLCACKQGFKREGNRCVIGGNCTTDPDCIGLENSFCNTTMSDRPYCACKENFLAATNNTRCLTNVRHNGDCDESAQCSYSNETECQDGKCQCKVKFKYDGAHCVRRLDVRHNGDCDESAQCSYSNETECRDGNCQCKAKFKFDGARCVRTPGIGGACVKTSDCMPENVAICVNGVCKCIGGYVPNRTGCIRVANHGEKCEESVQCNYSNETVCREGTCKCKDAFIYNGKRCVGIIPLGSPCERDIECVVPYDLKQETVWCYSKICVCKNGFKAEGDRCVIGGDCTDDSGCKDLGNAFCNKLKRDRYYCACIEGYLPLGNNTKCLPVVHEIGTGCEYDEQCSKKLGQAVCVGNQCQCAEGARLTEDKTCSAAVSSVISLSCLLMIWLVKIF